jgi:diguanylate cyclase (GGDEF)-like protein
MNDIIRDIRELCEAEYCCIYLFDEQERTCEVLCEDLAEWSKMPQYGNVDDLDFYEIAKTWEDTIAGSNCLVVKDEQGMEVLKGRNPDWHDSMVVYGVKTIMLFPIKYQSELLGYMWATNFDPENAGRIKETLELTTYVLGLEISSHLLMNKLRVLSSRDILTGVHNRNEMNNRVDDLKDGKLGDGKPIGVVFADLNGLKRVNDVEGHAAGDELLRNAARAMLDVFDDDEVFRVGGDEFLALMVGATEQDIERKIKALREAAQNYEKVVFAIGGCVVQDGRDVRRALRISDQLMYEDKSAYYKAHPKAE